ncbi:hypothetical protein FACS1894186_8070 [Alphaproteobacteria bacterium]|nr:hypothetical protein FACS1894186_8070 [Alphaproteobacteria bacterium]
MTVELAKKNMTLADIFRLQRLFAEELPPVAPVKLDVGNNIRTLPPSAREMQCYADAHAEIFRGLQQVKPTHLVIPMMGGLPSAAILEPFMEADPDLAKTRVLYMPASSSIADSNAEIRRFMDEEVYGDDSVPVDRRVLAFIDEVVSGTSIAKLVASTVNNRADKYAQAHFFGLSTYEKLYRENDKSGSRSARGHRRMLADMTPEEVRGITASINSKVSGKGVQLVSGVKNWNLSQAAVAFLKRENDGEHGMAEFFDDRERWCAALEENFAMTPHAANVFMGSFLDTVLGRIKSNMGSTIEQRDGSVMAMKTRGAVYHEYLIPIIPPMDNPSYEPIRYEPDIDRTLATKGARTTSEQIRASASAGMDDPGSELHGLRKRVMNRVRQSLPRFARSNGQWVEAMLRQSVETAAVAEETRTAQRVNRPNSERVELASTGKFFAFVRDIQDLVAKNLGAEAKPREGRRLLNLAAIGRDMRARG